MKGSYQRVGGVRVPIGTNGKVAAARPRPPPGPADAPLLPFQAPAQRTWMIHVHGPTVRENKSSRLNRPLVIVRRSDRLKEMIIARAVDVLGPSRLMHHHQTPLPDTEGNAIAYFETTGELTLYFDPPPATLGIGLSVNPLTADIPEPLLIREPLTDEVWSKRAQRATHFIRR